MYKHSLPVAIALAGFSLTALAEESKQHGFIEDSKASITARNFYINQA